MADSAVGTARVLFIEALAQHPGERGAFLERACAADPDLLAEIRSLLEADARADGFLEPPIPRPAPSPLSVLPAGTVVGQFEIVRPIGRGGMGTVYEALQKHPSRTVALKVLNASIASPAALRRFEYEAQVLARLRHPHIAQVYEAGLGDGLPPFIAMEFVAQARTILEYAAAAGLDPGHGVELVAQVCDAVHHGHTRGIIHRDIKPGNVLVDEFGAPKVIDFGVARAVDRHEGAHTLDTLPGQVVGTLRYMSPEQCGQREHALDTRSDVYALGLLLYEILTGRLPYELDNATLFDAPRIIREAPPIPPSRLVRAFDKDLETIILKALEKEPQRRYQTALALAEDLRRYLTGTAIDARRDSAWYVLRKTVKRHRLAFGAACTVLAVLAISAGALWAMYLRQGRLLEESRTRAHQTQAALAWLQSNLASLDPGKAQWRDTHVLREQLADASRRIGSDFADQPEAEAAMRMTVGNLYDSIGLYPDAEAHIRRALDIRRALHSGDHPDVAATLTSLGETLASRSQLPAAHALFREALDMRERLYASAPHPDLAYSINREAWAALSRHEFAESERLFNRARTMYHDLYGDEHADIAKTSYGLGVLFYNQADYDRSEPYLRESVDLYRRVSGDDCPAVAGGRMVIAKLLHARGRYDQAEPMFHAALDGYRRLYGNEHPEVAWGLHRLGRMLHDAGRDPEAEPMIREALGLYQRFLGDASPYVAFCLESLGTVLMDNGDLAQAETCFLSALETWNKAEGNGEPRSDWQLNRLACLRAAQGRDQEAEGLLRRALAAADDRTAETATEVTTCQQALGRLLISAQRRTEGAGLLAQALDTLTSRLGSEHPQTIKAAAEFQRIRTTDPDRHGNVPR